MESEVRGTSVPTPVDIVQAQIQRILASRRFAASARHCRLLRYLLQQTLEGRGGQLKEYVLGVEVFDRGEGFDPQTDPIVRTELSRLRAKLTDYYGSEGRDDSLIVDLPRRSYSLSFRVKEAPASNPAPRPARIRWSWKWMVSGVCLIAGAAACLVWLLSGSLVPRQKRLDGDLASVAVLPFINLNGDPETEIFSDGLTEQLIDCLAEVEGLRVVSRTSSFQFKGNQSDLRAIAARLNVGIVLEGTVSRSGDHLRIATRLVNAANGYQLHSEVYERGVQDLLAVQEEIARQAANMLRGAMACGRGGVGINQITKNAQAFGLSLRGRHHANLRSETELRKAISCFEQAIAADPHYAVAHAGLANSHIQLALLNESPPREAMQKAKEAAQSAVRTGDAFSHAHSALGSVLSLYDRDWSAAEQEFHRSIKLDPNDSAIRESYAMHYLAPRGQLDSALFELQLAQRLDPLSPEIALALAKIQLFRRDHNRAIELIKEASHLGSGSEGAPLTLALAYVHGSRWDLALQTLNGAFGPTEDEARLAVLGRVYALSGQPERAREILERLRVVARQRYVSGYYFALIYLALGENTSALDWLEKAADERCPQVIYLKVDPQLESLRADPRFQALRKRLGVGS